MSKRLAVFCLAFLPNVASAAEVQLEGFYRARLRGYDTLSLNRDLADSEGAAIGVEHRLWLRPRILVSDNVVLQADVLGFDGLNWGNTNLTALEDGTELPVQFSDELRAPGYDTDGLERDAYRDITLWRAWAEVKTPIGRLSFGRMPLQWGLGLWQNDGLGYDADRGDSGDRVRWDKVFDDVFAEVAVDVNTEGLVNGTDDTTSFNAAFGYRSELVTTGLQAQLRRTPANNLTLLTASAAFQAEIGTLDVKAEIMGQFGNADTLGDVNDAQIAGFGGVLDASLHTSALDLGVELGYASGDNDSTDNKLTALTFDRDYEIGLIMFEQPLPVLEGTGTTGRNYDQTQSLPGVSNAMFVKPRISRGIIDGLTGEASILGARLANVSDTLQETGRNTYGFEGNLGVRWKPVEHFELVGTAAVFLPGTFYTKYEDETYSGFDSTVYAGQILGQVRF